MAIDPHDIAIWVITPNGVKIARRLAAHWPSAAIRLSRRLAAQASGPIASGLGFDALARAVADDFGRYKGHIFIMATGIAVRMIAPCLRHKTVDPAVVVADDLGRHAISLVAGHMGGANRLAETVARIIGARPVITTATDINGKPSVDLLASAAGLKIENPGAVKTVNMALLTGDKLAVHDPYGLLGDALSAYAASSPVQAMTRGESAGVFVDDTLASLPESVLVLRPASLWVGIGCNRDTTMLEIGDLLDTVLRAHQLSINSIAGIASIDLKADEPGLISLSRQLGTSLEFFSKEQLNRIRHVPNPSAMAAKHVGVSSVCEAAAILAAGMGTLIVPKHKSLNATVAIARRPFMSSASVREV